MYALSGYDFFKLGWAKGCSDVFKSSATYATTISGASTPQSFPGSSDHFQQPVSEQGP